MTEQTETRAHAHTHTHTADTVEQRGASVLVTSTLLDDEGNDDVVSEPKPTGKVVGIVSTRRRPYCGILVNAKPTDTRVLFSAQDERIPFVRIHTSQTQSLIGKQLVVVIDAWPSSSKYPVVSERVSECECVCLTHARTHTHTLPPFRRQPIATASPTGTCVNRVT